VRVLTHWHANFKEGNELTMDIYLLGLTRYCEEFGTTPQALAAKNSRDAYKLLVNAVQGFRERHCGIEAEASNIPVRPTGACVARHNNA
jgi:hypothetical protein